MIDALNGFRLALLGGWLGSAAFVHLRGRVRHPFLRQLVDHSTLLAPYNALVYLFSKVANRPLLDIEQFPELATLTDNWEVIRDEAVALHAAGHVRASQKHNDIAFNSFFRRGWTRFYLRWYDDMLPSAREHCPRTVALVESIPSVNAALFAILPPGGKLGEHRDPFAGSIRYHLGLATPNDDACAIWIDGEVHSWRDGEPVVFDETFVHTARNDTDQQRIILFCDVTRPLHQPMRLINQLVIRYLVRITATQNTDTEKVGIVNRLSGAIHAWKSAMKRVKRRNKRLYQVGKVVVLGGLAYVVLLHGLT